MTACLGNLASIFTYRKLTSNAVSTSGKSLRWLAIKLFKSEMNSLHFNIEADERLIVLYLKGNEVFSFTLIKFDWA